MRWSFLSLLAGVSLLAAPAGAQSIAGEWNASINTPGGTREFKIVFQVDGEKVTGTVKREAGDVALEGTIKGDTLRFSYTINYNGNALELSMVAKVTGDSMTGMVSFAGQAEDVFSAKRAPRSPPPAG